MSQMKKSVQKEEAQRNMYISLCIVALVALIGYGAFSVADAFVVDQPKMLDSKQVAALGRTHYRFREIYRGPKMETNRSTSDAPVVSASHSRLSSGKHAASSSAAVSTANGSVSMSGAYASGSTLRTTSSAEPHTYGGGASMGGITGGTYSSGSHSMATPSASYSVAAPSMAYARRAKPSVTMTTDNSVGPAVYYAPSDDGIPGGAPVEDGGKWWMWDEDKEDWKEISLPDNGDKIEIAGVTYCWNGSAWVLDQGGDISDLGTPLGDVPFFALFFLVAAYLIYRKKKVARWA